MTNVGIRLDLEFTKDTPYLTLAGNLKGQSIKKTFLQKNNYLITRHEVFENPPFMPATQALQGLDSI